MMRVAILFALWALVCVPAGSAAEANPRTPEVPEGFVRVEPGTFLMGSASGERDEQPVHAVTITRPFIISTLEVTFDQYDQFCEELGIGKPPDEEWGRGKLPVINVSWYEALDYCNWLSWKQGLTPCYSLAGSAIVCDFSADGYRLPTEAEWEYAARGGMGSAGYIYAGGNQADEVAWYDKTGERDSDIIPSTHEVGGKGPNELGLFDMSGNVWEWCWDYYEAYGSGDEADPVGPASGKERVIRGGSWNNDAYSARATFRFRVMPLIFTSDVGFRVVRAGVATLLAARFDGGAGGPGGLGGPGSSDGGSADESADGFVYVDDAFGTSQPAHASGATTATGGYGGSGGLAVRLGGVDGAAVPAMSGGWRHALDLSARAEGVEVAFRYIMRQSAGCDYDDYSRVLMSLDGKLHGQGARSYIDHAGGDAGGIGHTTRWMQARIHVGSLAAGSHTLVLGGYANQKDAADESAEVVLDEVVVTSGNPAPAATAAETLVGRLSLEQFRSDTRSVGGFGDRMHRSGSDATSYYNALAWVEQQLQAMGYATARHTYTHKGYPGANLYATKVGTVRPDRMYLVTGMLDGRGGGQALDDNAAGVSLVLQAARAFAGPDVRTDISVRFVFWDQEEWGLIGSAAYVGQRWSMQGRENPPGSGQYPEPTWLGMISHDGILYDHGVTIHTPPTSQSPYADLDVEFKAGTSHEVQSEELAYLWRQGNRDHAEEYPANVGDQSRNTDDMSFWDVTAAMSVRANRQQYEWVNPFYHTPGDLYENYGDDDFRLGFAALRTTVGTIAELAGARIVGSGKPAQ